MSWSKLACFFMTGEYRESTEGDILLTVERNTPWFGSLDRNEQGWTRLYLVDVIRDVRRYA